MDYAFHVIAEILDTDGETFANKDLGGSNDVEPSDFFEELQGLPWDTIIWYNTEDGDVVFIHEFLPGCDHGRVSIIDETICGVEYECDICGERIYIEVD